jgi:cytochrome c553
MKHIFTAASLVILGFAASTAYAQDTKEALYTRALAATCANCHGTNGKAVSGSPVIGLAGLPASYISDQMKAFKTAHDLQP